MLFSNISCLKKHHIKKWGGRYPFCQILEFQLPKGLNAFCNGHCTITFAFPAWTITTLSAFYLLFPFLLSTLNQLSSTKLSELVFLSYLWQFFSAFLFYAEDCGITQDLICRHPLPRCLRFQNWWKTGMPRLPVFVIGMAAGLIRLRSGQEQLENHPTPAHITVVGISERGWKTRVDLCSLLLLSVPLLAQLAPLPQLGFLAQILFILPQLFVILGKLRKQMLSEIEVAPTSGVVHKLCNRI